MNIDEELIRIAVIAAVGAWGVTSAVKPIVHKYLGEAWNVSAVRLLALGAGAAFGFAMAQSADGALAGVAGGALSATIVGALKRIIASKASAPSLDDD